jgi:two-component SAPR family response regulator
MQKNIERQILLFTEATGLTKKAEVVHGTLFVKFNNPQDKWFFRRALRNFCRIFINRDTGINANEVGEEFAYDIVPEKDEKKSWNKVEPLASTVDTYLELANEMTEGK